MTRRFLLPLVAVITIIAMLMPGCTPTTTYKLTMAEDPAVGGTATDVTGASPYAAGTEVDIQATANAGYVFTGWTTDAGGIFDDAGAATTKFSMPSNAVTVTAHFVPVFDLDMLANPNIGGTATDLTNTSPYTEDTEVDIQAVAAPGYEFTHWTVDPSGAGSFDNANHATTTYTMPAEDVTVTAHFVPVFDLVMLADPSLGGTATDLTGSSPYAQSAVVDIQAIAAAGYHFDGWTAPAGTITTPNAATTTFIMPDENAEVTADFAPGPGPLDHFTGYWVDWDTSPYIGEEVYLEDQFISLEAVVHNAIAFGNPADKLHDEVLTPIQNPNHHLTIYDISYEVLEQEWYVEVDNQFGPQQFTVWGPIGLAVPTQKEGHDAPVNLDHYLVYIIWEAPAIGVTVGLQDQWLAIEEVVVYEPVLFANPVRKTHGDTVTEIWNPDEHVVIYSIGEVDFATEIQVVNQFGEQTLDLYGPDFLAVPSEKTYWEGPPPPLDHFRAYWAEDVTGLPVGEVVLLEDQFDVVEAVVANAALFCNPVEKWHDGLPTEIINPDHHLTIYSIEVPEWKEWTVLVDNQFGTQQFTVFGPVGLAVPTQKEDHAPPLGLDHYLLYEVVAGSPVNVVVDLFDQFLNQPGVMVYEPVLFANPVRKTHDGMITEIENPDGHLVFYQTDHGLFTTEIPIINQFGEQTLSIHLSEYLAVPSEKIGFTVGPPLANVAVLGDYEFQLTALLWENGISAQPRDWDVVSDIADYDAVVVNSPYDPGSATFIDFLDAANAAGVGVVFTSSWPESNPWGIQLLQWHLEDPANHDYSCCYGDVYYKVTEAHPIFDGWSVGDEITIITGGDNDHSWFSGYSGTTIAQVGSASGGLQGDAVAVGSYGGSTHVLLASLGPQSWTDESAWTDDARTIFINAVLFAVSGAI